MVAARERVAARLDAFKLVEAVQVRDVGDALADAQTRAREQSWPEVTRVLLYAEMVRADLRSDPALGELISRLHDEADLAGDQAMLSVALATRAEHCLTSDDPAVRQGFDNDVARATALVNLSLGGALERATAYIACAIAYSSRDLWELEEDLYAAATPVLAECELPLLDDAVLSNRAEAAVRLLCGLREVGAIDELHRLQPAARRTIEAALSGGMPAPWKVEIAVYGHLLSALVDGCTPEPSAVLDKQIVEYGLAATPVVGLLRLADALCAADADGWETVADQAEQATGLLTARFASSARALALRLAAQAEAALGNVGARHALCYAEYSTRRHWESRTQMVGAARASTHTEHLRIERDMHARDAMVDELTGLANRRGYSRYLDRLHRRGVHRPMAALLIDIDRFKAVNDTYGHAIGDKVLARVAQELAAATRPTDVVARLGGDEFVTLLDDVDVATARQRAVDLLGRLATVPWHSFGPDLRLAASIGVAVGEPGDDPERVLRLADAALYAAKARGGDLVEVALIGTDPSAAA